MQHFLYTLDDTAVHGFRLVTILCLYLVLAPALNEWKVGVFEVA
jgi:hypothetical protein